MMHGREKSDLAIVAMKPANKANEPTAEASTGANAAEPVERRAGAKGNAHQQSTHWTQSQARVSQALERIRQAIAVIHPRWEPYAGKPPVRFCAGGAMKIASLPLQRRDFITLLGGAVAWPLAARAQQGERMRRIGVLMNLAADDPESQRRMTAFLQGLQQLGWTDGRNVRIETRWGASDADRIRKYAAELVAFAPDVILTAGTPTLGPLLQATRAVPLVFVHVPDPVGAGFVDSLARPGGNATGFILLEYATSAKWLELLKEIAPRVTRAAVIRDPAITAGIGQWGAIQTAAPSFGIEVSPVNVRDAPEIERAVSAFARVSNGGLMVTGSALTAIHRS